VQEVYNRSLSLKGKVFRLRLRELTTNNLFVVSSITLLVSVCLLFSSLPAISGSASQTTLTTQHSAKNIAIYNRFSHIEISSWSQNYIQITRTGPQKQVNNATLELNGNILIIKDPTPPPLIIEKGGEIHSRVEIHSTQIARGGRLVVNETTIRPSDLPPPLYWKIQVPKQQSITVYTLDGHLKADTLHGLVMEVGGGDVTIQHCCDCRIKLDGPGDINMQNASGRLFIKQLGVGDINIHLAELYQLDIQSDGSGDINIGGKIKRAKITLDGTGDISLESVENLPHITNRGVGDIEIENSLWLVE
jgi:hypothetical protein